MNDCPSAAARRKRWAQLLRQVFEIDPLACPSCGEEMQITSFITTAQQPILERVLDHLGMERAPPTVPHPPRWVEVQQAKTYMEDYSNHFPTDPIYEEPTWVAR